MTVITGRAAVVTGGARGLGLAVARELCRKGAKVALWDSSPEALAEALASLRSENLEARGCAVDVSDPVQVRAAAEKTRSELGPVDILDNNAGVVYRGSFLEISAEDIRRTLEVNLLSYIHCARVFLPSMLERGGGHIIMTASAAGLMGVPGMAVYSASKHAVVGLAESLRLELRGGPNSVGMTIVCPSFIATGMFEGARPPRGTSWLSADALAARIVAAVASGELHVREPFLIKLIPLIKLLPTALADAIGDRAGLNSALQDFRRK